MNLGKGVIITATDTGVGKTLCAAHLLKLTQGTYWKPIQTGDDRDLDVVQRISSLPQDHFLPETYRYKTPCSPHLAAALENRSINIDTLTFPEIQHYPLIVEGAGGVLVPLANGVFMIDLFKKLGLPVIVVARSTLGTINHTLLTLEALSKRKISVLGVVTVGPYHPENEEAIQYFGSVKVIGRIRMEQPVEDVTTLECL